MTNQQAKELRNQINLLAAELDDAINGPDNGPKESLAMLKNRKARIQELERQLTEG